MKNDIKQELSKIEIPPELHSRVEYGIKKVKKDKQDKKKRAPKWLAVGIAAIIFAGVGFGFASDYIVEAKDSIFNKLFGSKEEVASYYPKKGDKVASYLETHLELAEKELSKEEFKDFSLLTKERTDILLNMRKDNRNNLNAEEEKKIRIVDAKIEQYEIKLAKLTTHTFEEAQKLASYPVKKPTYVPDGYKLTEEHAQSEEKKPGKNPVVSLEYREEEFGFSTEQQKVDVYVKDAFDSRNFQNTEPFESNGYKLEYGYDDDSNIKGMKITSLENEYVISIIADMLSKEEMEKILLSMVTEVNNN